MAALRLTALSLALSASQFAQTQRLDSLYLRHILTSDEAQSSFTPEVRLVRQPLAALSPGGNMLAVAQRGELRVWSVSTGQEFWRVDLAGASVDALAFKPAGDEVLLAIGPSLTNVNLRTREVSRSPGFWKKAMAVAVSGGAIAWAESGVREVIVRSIGTRSELRRFGPHSSEVLGLAFSPDGQRLAATEDFRLARLWDLRSPCLQQIFPNRSGELLSASFSAAGRWMAITGPSSVQIVDVASGLEFTRFVPPSGRLLGAAVSASGAVVAVAWDEGIRLYQSAPILPKERVERVPTLHTLVIGINGYRDPSLNLRFPEDDAGSIATVLEQHARSLAFRPAPVRMLGACATEAEILRALGHLASQVRPEDGFLLFAAGHGRTIGSEFFFFPHDVIPGPTPRNAISATRLGEALANIRVRHRAVVLDACQSGPAARIILKAASSMTPRTLIILAASAATEEAMEAPRLGHGLLTAALIEGFGDSVKKGSRLTMAGWAQFAARRVPVIASGEDRSNTQQPEFIHVGEDFPLLAAEKLGTVAVPTDGAPGFQPLREPVDRPFACRPTWADQTYVRPEGVVETLGDVVMRCTGRIPSSPVKLSLSTSPSVSFTSGIVSGQRETDVRLILEKPGERLLTGSTGQVLPKGRLVNPNLLVWESVPIPSQGGTADFQLRMTNLRVNASQLGIGATMPGQPQAAGPMAATQSAVWKVEAVGERPSARAPSLATIIGPLSSALLDCQGNPAKSIVFDQAKSQNEALLNPASAFRRGNIQYSVRFQEAIPDHFLPAGRVLRSRPGRFGRPFVVDSEETGSRVILRLGNLPNGTRVFVTRDALRRTRSASARLIATDPNGGGPYLEVPASARGGCGSVEMPVAELPAVAGFAQAVWEVTASDPYELESLDFGLMVAFIANPGMNLPSLGTATWFSNYAPISTVSSASATAPVPRFVDNAIARSMFTVEKAVPILLFPEVEDRPTSGIVIVNGSNIPGTCNLFFASPGPPKVVLSQGSKPVQPGEELQYRLSLGGTHGLIPWSLPGACLAAICNFPQMQGFYGNWLSGSPRPAQRAIEIRSLDDPRAINPKCDFER